MKTDELIDMLARGAGAAPRAAVARRLWPACAVGLAVSAGFALFLIGPLPLSVFQTPAPWIKLGYTGALALAAAWLAAHAARPGASLELPRRAVVGVVLAMVALAAATTFFWTPREERARALLGETWFICPSVVLALSLPTLGLTLWAMRGLAPTQPSWAGFACGLLAGAIGALGYALACQEAAPAFVAIWYSLGIVLTGLLGAVLGPRLLRW